MSRIRQIVTVLMLFVLLFAVALTPKLILEHNNHQMVDKVHVDTISEKTLEPSEENNTIERIAIILYAVSNSNGVFTENNNISLSQEEANQLIGHLSEQIAFLQLNNVLPQFELSESYFIEYLSKITFMDRDNPSKVVNVWEILIRGSNYSVSLWIDTETFTMYQLGIYRENSEFNFDDETIQPLNFLEYLQIDSYYVSSKGDEYGNMMRYYCEQDNFFATCVFEKDKEQIKYYLQPE